MAPRGPTRRDIVQAFGRTGGLAGAFAAMQALGLVADAGPYTGPPQAPSRLGAGRRVVVLGAGIAGLVSAYELVKLGFDVTVLEARHRPGGRVWTVRGGDVMEHDHLPAQRSAFGPGHYFNAGAARIPAAHAGIHSYIREFGVPLEVQVNLNRDARYVAAAVKDGQPIQNREVAHNIRGGIAELLSKAVGKGALDSELGDVDKEFFLDFLADYGALQDDGSYTGSARLGYADEPTVLGHPGTPKPAIPLSELMREPSWGFIMSFGESLYQQAVMLEPVGGIDAIPYAFAARLRRQVRYGVRVTHVQRKDEGVRVLYTGAAGQAAAIEADLCICALPFSVARKLSLDVSAPVKTAIDTMEYETACKVAWESPRFWESEERIYGGLSYADTRCGMAWYPSYDFNNPRGVIVGCYNFWKDAAGFQEQPLEQQFEESRASVDRIHPGKGVLLGKPVAVNWGHVPHSMGSWAGERAAEEMPKDQIDAVLAGDGPIFFAGQHLSPIGAWMEAAVRSAHYTLARLYEKVQAA